MNRRRQRSPGSAGFTLIELLVSMVLLSLVVAGMASVIRSMAQTQERVDQTVDTSEDFRIATSLLEATAGRISGRRRAGVQKAGESPYLFLARPQELVWVGVMPARVGMGGRTLFRLALQGTPQSQDLTLWMAPWDGASESGDWSQAQRHLLVRGVTGFRLSYEDARHPVPVWVSEWQRSDSLPARMRIELATSAGDWPLWVIPMRLLANSESSGSRFTIGGSR
ncbi:prepilin-type N-terminal cleavage/methylation domain-containing protein [Comamonas sp. NLF-1-9]|uniref:prepilin-type N-terminal cleavage/methylation domain-containing protein n=1 Tax=Comamonas sp. NLF-1-9 TaxID=2853163 RepID=UPI001C471ECC|nr:prepilin-type N-terminal cleavage/methylation domain-containing protein [Comamonas sp. NLF-1-9]QXL83555.1 prepilin-type N-terminal cleavage/methylation domain-containing protein [Comamonas sp. NLF-1-9]